MNPPNVTPVTWLYMQAAADTDRAQAPEVALADRIVGLIDDLSRRFETEAGGNTHDVKPNR